MDIQQIRNDTPACQDKIFLNSAGASLMPHKVLESMQDYLKHEEKLGGYKVAELRKEEIESFYKEVATLINAEAHQIAFTFSATEAYAKALSSIPFQPEDVILTSNDDYVSNQINFISLKQRFKLNIIRVNNKPNGDLDLNDLEQKIQKHHPILVAITHVPTNSGLVQDVAGVGNICARHQVLYLLDACQSVGQFSVDVKEIQCDFMSVTGRKFLRGPRGTGFLYVSDKVLSQNYAPLFIDLRGAEWTSSDQFQMIESAKRFESWEIPYASLIGLKEAVKYANDLGIEHIEAYNQRLMHQLRDRLVSIVGVKLFDQGSRTCNILTFQKEGKSLDQIKDSLDAHHVFYSTTSKSSALIDFEKKGIDWVVRLSSHYFNTIEEMDKVADIIHKI